MPCLLRSLETALLYITGFIILSRLLYIGASGLRPEGSIRLRSLRNMLLRLTRRLLNYYRLTLCIHRLLGCSLLFYLPWSGHSCRSNHFSYYFNLTRCNRNLSPSFPGLIEYICSNCQ